MYCLLADWLFGKSLSHLVITSLVLLLFMLISFILAADAQNWGVFPKSKPRKDIFDYEPIHWLLLLGELFLFIGCLMFSSVSSFLITLPAFFLNFDYVLTPIGLLLIFISALKYNVFSSIFLAFSSFIFMFYFTLLLQVVILAVISIAIISFIVEAFGPVLIVWYIFHNLE